MPGPDTTFKIPWLLPLLVLGAPGVSEPTRVAHLRCRNHLCLVLFHLSFLGRALLAPIISRPSIRALHLNKLQLLVQALQCALRATDEAWDNGTGTADRKTPASPVVFLPGWLCGTAEEVRKAVQKLVFYPDASVIRSTDLK